MYKKYTVDIKINLEIFSLCRILKMWTSDVKFTYKSDKTYQ